MGDGTEQSTGQDTIGQIQGALQSAADSAAAFNGFATTIETIMAQLGVTPDGNGEGDEPAQSPIEAVRTEVNSLGGRVASIETGLPTTDMRIDLAEDGIRRLWGSTYKLMDRVRTLEAKGTDNTDTADNPAFQEPWMTDPNEPMPS